MKTSWRHMAAAFLCEVCAAGLYVADYHTPAMWLAWASGMLFGVGLLKGRLAWWRHDANEWRRLAHLASELGNARRAITCTECGSTSTHGNAAACEASCDAHDMLATERHCRSCGVVFVLGECASLDDVRLALAEYRRDGALVGAQWRVSWPGSEWLLTPDELRKP